MMNVYNGNIHTDAAGNATVTLPDWFETLNRDFRYQLTVIGQFAQAIVASKIANNQFTIKRTSPMLRFPGKSRVSGRMPGPAPTAFRWRRRSRRLSGAFTYTWNCMASPRRGA
jgi:hypothetical protein